MKIEKEEKEYQQQDTGICSLSWVCLFLNNAIWPPENSGDRIQHYYIINNK